jgi:ATP-dependent RNA helicase RhlE
VHFVDANRKRELLSHLVKKNDWDQVLVFCKTKHGANRLASQLQKDHINADAIHGNKSQNARIKALEDFKSGKVKVLVATDIAARGLDIEELPHVVNFDLPHVAEDYVHRIGRTGRAGCTGEALSLVCSEDRPLLGAIERLINRKIETRPVNGFEAGFGSSHASESKPDALTHSEPRGRRQGQGQGQGRGQGQGQGQGRGERAPRHEDRKPREERKPREDRPPRPSTATSAAPRTSGNSGGMDFSKPYEPAPVKESLEQKQPDQDPVRKRTGPAVPALFRRKAA